MANDQVITVLDGDKKIVILMSQTSEYSKESENQVQAKVAEAKEILIGMGVIKPIQPNISGKLLQ